MVDAGLRGRRLMKHGIVIEDTDFRVVSEIAREADQSGWDGVFIPDAIAVGMGPAGAMRWFDPWVVLGALAIRTERIRIGTFITPLSRRRPWKVVRETVTVDHLSGGRLILGVGLGAADDDDGFNKVGEVMELKERAKLM